MHERLQAIPGVEKVALTNSVPMGGSISILTYNVGGQARAAAQPGAAVHFADVSPGYFATLGIPVVQGREFDAAATRWSTRGRC